MQFQSVSNDKRMSTSRLVAYDGRTVGQTLQLRHINQFEQAEAEPFGALLEGEILLENLLQ